jgi:hypothetical protein
MSGHCRCKHLKAPQDAVLMGYNRLDCIVVFNRSHFIIPTCDNGHVVEPFTYILCDPEQSEVDKNVKAKNLKVVFTFDRFGNYNKQ